MKLSDLKKKIDEAKTSSPVDIWAAIKNKISHDNTLTSEESHQLLDAFDSFIGNQAIELGKDSKLEEIEAKILKMNLDPVLKNKAMKMFNDAYEVVYNNRYDLKRDVEKMLGSEEE